MATDAKLARFRRDMAALEPGKREIEAARSQNREPDKTKLLSPRKRIRIRLRCKIRWPAAGGLPEVQYLPNLHAKPGQRRPDSWSYESKLVRFQP